MSEVLSSWKEIAAYFGKSVRTVQRWERWHALPIHRPTPFSIMAYPAELDAWLRQNDGQAAAIPESLSSLRPGSPSTRILVVDDERPIADMLNVILQQAGFEVAVAYDGWEAIAIAQSFLPDIVLADYYMPNLNGIEACIQIKRRLPACRMIMLSGHTLSEEFAPYPTGYDFLLLSKPLHPTDLLRALAAERIEPSGSGERLRVLNVDDVEAHRYSLTRLFTRAGFDVIEERVRLRGTAFCSRIQARCDPSRHSPARSGRV